jgi:glycosyltransferase involved in cell wall biosynthesis
MISAKKLNITFPVLNEESQLEESMIRTVRFCENHNLENIEICIADNGSTDRTEVIGRHVESRMKKVKYLRIPKRGFGLALKTSWALTQADYVGYMDLDLSTNLKHLSEVYELIQTTDKIDLILGSRLKSGATVEKRTLLREITSRSFNCWLQLNLNVGFTDGMCGFKFIERNFYEHIAARFEFTDEWFFATELAVRVEWMGGRVLDLPIHWIDDANSKSSAQLFRLIKQYAIGIERLRQEKKSRFACHARAL